MKKKKIDEATLRLGKVLDSRAVVGLGERKLLSGHVREWGNHGGSPKCFGGSC